MREIIYTFGDFRLSPARFQLTRLGEELRLERKPFALLLLLARSQGRLVTRTEIAANLWGEDVFVDTEHGINTAIRKLRVALGESAESPRFLQTVTGLGYRLLGVTETVEGSDDPSITTPVSPQQQNPADPFPTEQTHLASTPNLRPRLWTLAVACILALAAVTAMVEHLHLRASPVHPHTPSSAADHPPEPHPAPGPTISEQAREQYQRGVYLYDRRNAVASADAFRRAIELAPGYAPSFAGLAQSLDAQSKLSDGVPGTVIPEAIAAARHAIALDPRSDAGYVALGSIETAFTWDWQDAERNLVTGLKINPGNASGHIWYAVLLQSARRNDEAIEQARLAVAAAPLSFFAVRMRGSILYYARDYENAMRSLERAEEMTPQHPNVVDNWIALVDEQRGLYDAAVTHYLLSLEQSLAPAEIERLRTAYQRRGWRGFWQARLDQLAQQPMHGCTLYKAGVAYLQLNDHEHALQVLHEAAEQHCFWLGMIEVDPALDPLRTDKRFQDIVHIVEPNTPTPPQQTP